MKLVWRLLTGGALALVALMCSLPTGVWVFAPAFIARGAAGLALAQPLAVDLGWAAQMSAGGAHTCAVTLAGTVKCWGLNEFSALGDGTTRNRVIPVAVVGLPDAPQTLSAGWSHTCVVTADGGAWCWGHNDWGQLGDGSTTSRSTAGAVVGLSSGVQALSAGLSHTCALTTAGGVKCWGWNGHGQLGDGTTTDRLTPVDVVGLSSGVQALSARGWHTCALTTAGGVKCWGGNTSGQLGDGTTTDRLTAVDVVGLASGVQALSAGDGHTCALTTAGGVACWGWNHYGALGDGTTTARAVPGAVVGLDAGVRALSSGFNNTCAVLASDGVVCWGHGPVGDGTTANRLTPVAVQGLPERARAVTMGGGHICALLASGAVQCWGGNQYGQLGDGTTADRLAPTPVILELPYDCTVVSEILPHECQALVTLFRATNGPFWQAHTAWLQTATPCSWYGVTCAAGHVSQLNLPNNNLADILPAALSDLPALQRLDLHGNDLEGPLPAELGKLSALQTLDLHDNELTGAVAPALLVGGLTALQTLDLSANQFSGTLPASLSLLDTLRTLDLSHNQLRDSIPFHLADLKQLTYLDLSHNNLTGSLPFGYLVDPPSPLQYLDLSHNQFNGDFDFASNTIPAVTHLDLSHNALFWEIPRQLGSLTALTYLDLHANRFSGVIQPDLGNLHALTYLDLSANHLTYNIPAELGGIGSAITTTTAITINLAGNHLLDSIPATLGGIAGLRSLDLAGNQLSGAVPAAIAEHPLVTLNLNYNRLEPSDPRWRDTQTVAPTDLRAVADGTAVRVTWTPIPYGADGPYEVVYATYEISYATDPGGPFTVAGRTTDNGVANYTVTGLAPATVYHFRVRTFTPAHPYWGPDGEILYQQNNLWSDYTPLVSVNVAPTPRVFLPFVWR